MKCLHEIEDAVCDRLQEIADEIGEKGRLPDNCIEMTDYLTHTLKSIVTVCAMYESGYSEDGGYSGRGSYGNGSSMDGGSYADGYSGRRGRSRTTGRFVSRDSSYSGRRGYSRDDGGQSVIGEIDEIMRNTSDNAVKQRLEALKQRMNNDGGQM